MVLMRLFLSSDESTCFGVGLNNPFCAVPAQFSCISSMGCSFIADWREFSICSGY